MLADCYWLACASGILTFVAGFAVGEHALQKALLNDRHELSVSSACPAGSNNFSAAWAPAVGAKAITFRRAVVLGTICEALGCLVVGVRSTPLFLLNVIHYQAWIPSPQLAIFVIVCAQACASIWVLLATHFRLSASLLHATGETAVQQMLLCLPCSGAHQQQAAPHAVLLAQHRELPLAQHCIMRNV